MSEDPADNLVNNGLNRFAGGLPTLAWGLIGLVALVVLVLRVVL